MRLIHMCSKAHKKYKIVGKINKKDIVICLEQLIVA